jgi:hypothetical protein
MMKWTLQDQLSFPIIADKHGLEVNVCTENLMDNKYFKVVAHHRMHEYEKSSDLDMYGRESKS